MLDERVVRLEGRRTPALAEMQKRIGRKSIGKKILADVPVVFMAYDILEFEGEDIRQRPISKRQAGLLERIVVGASRLFHADFGGLAF